MNKDFDEKEHRAIVRMSRLLTSIAVGSTLDQKSPPKINHHERALEQCPIALTACHVIARSTADPSEPWFELRDSIDASFPIFLRLATKTREALITFPVGYQRVIACHVFDRNPLTFTVNQDKTLYEARLTPEQTKTVFKALRIKL